jgi:cobalt-zinc-cadmium efflux system membrane fusion protein
MIKKIIILIVIYGTLFFVNGCVNNNNQSQDSEKKHSAVPHSHSSEEQVIHLSGEVEKQINIKTTEVQPGLVKSTLKAMGKVLPPNDRKAIVGYAYSARIVGLHSAVGQWVEKDRPLVTIECEEVGNAQSEFVKALTDYELSKVDYEREERLFKKDIGAKKDHLEAKARNQIAHTALNAAEKKLMVLGLSKEKIREISETKNVSSRVTVNAPISGRIVMNNAVLGAVVEAPNEIMVIMNLKNLWIDAEIFEKDLSKVKKGQEVDVVVPAYPEEHFHGQIHYIGDVVNSDTRTITVRTIVENSDFRLKPGMFADITILTGNKESAVTIPVEAVLDDDDRKIVFIQDKDHYALRIVETGIRYNGDIEIVKGLSIGEIVVVEGNFQLKSRLRQETISHSHTH